VPDWKLRFSLSEMQHWASRYSFPGESAITEEIAPSARQRGHLTRGEFLEICRWKSPRTAPRVESNSAHFVAEATRLALGASTEELRIGILLSLRGVGWPTASVILHFCAEDPYPILDFRVLYSLTVTPPSSYTFPSWWEYTEVVRSLASETSLDMRAIDRALWQYSKENENRDRRGTAKQLDGL